MMWRPLPSLPALLLLAGCGDFGSCSDVCDEAAVRQVECFDQTCAAHSQSALCQNATLRARLAEPQDECPARWESVMQTMAEMPCEALADGLGWTWWFEVRGDTAPADLLDVHPLGGTGP